MDEKTQMSADKMDRLRELCALNPPSPKEIEERNALFAQVGPELLLLCDSLSDLLQSAIEQYTRTHPKIEEAFDLASEKADTPKAQMIIQSAWNDFEDIGLCLGAFEEDDDESDDHPDDAEGDAGDGDDRDE